MRRREWLFVLTLLAAVAVAAEAQVRGRDSVRVRVAPRDGRGFGYIFGPGDVRFDFRRPRLGVVVTLAPDAARDSLGAHVESVTPGGPADRAGIRADDIITRMNGTRLAVTDPADRDDSESRPGRRLINLAQRLDPGDTVRLEVRRDGRTQTFTLQAAESDLDMIVERMREPGFRGLAPAMPEDMFRIPGEPGGQVRVFAFGGRDIELVNVSPQLAEGLGLGTSEGLLIVDIGSDTALGLRAGDVILTIGGRRPTSPAHAMRILSTYEANEQVQFEVMRQRRRATVTGRLPQNETRWRVRPNRFEMPMRNRMPLMQWEHRLEQLMEPGEGLPRMRTRRAPEQLIKTEGKV